jgi:predicted nucleotidyltransferase
MIENPSLFEGLNEEIAYDEISKEFKHALEHLRNAGYKIDDLEKYYCEQLNTSVETMR